MSIYTHYMLEYMHYNSKRIIVVMLQLLLATSVNYL